MLNSPLQWVRCREEHYIRHLGPLTEPAARSSFGQGRRLFVYQFKPHANREHWTLITGGMSDYQQPLPPGTPEYVSPRTEIMMYVREPKQWMFDVLMGLAEIPFREQTHLHWWHTVPNGMPMTPQPSLLTNFFLIPPFCESVDFDSLRIDDQRVQFLVVLPITDEELEFKLKQGATALLKIFEDKDFDCIVKEERQSYV
jgi:hypothetical protein